MIYMIHQTSNHALMSIFSSFISPISSLRELDEWLITAKEVNLATLELFNR